MFTNNLIAGASGNQGFYPFDLEQSLRFNDDDSAYLSWTPASAGNRKTWTWSGWIKSNSTDNQRIFQTGTTLGTGNYFGLSWQNSGKLFLEDAGGFQLFTTALHRDPSAWYHIVVAVDTTQATSTNRIKLYVNGVQRTSFSTESYPGQNTNTSMNNTVLHYIGAEAYEGPRRHLDGYLAEINLIDGSALDPEDFGEFDDNGVWRPIEVTGLTYGSQGFYLTFDPSATNGIGHDHSGNGNNFTPTGFDTTNTGAATYDVMSDTPTTNWATLNPLAVTGSVATLSDGNLQAVTPVSGHGNVFATMPIPSSGKWYWECKGTAGNPNFTAFFGVSSYNSIQTPMWTNGNHALYYDQGEKYVDNAISSYGSTYTINDLIGVACDADAGTIEFYKNGTSQGSFSHTMVDMFPAAADASNTTGSTFVFNFGQRAFEQTPPTGYKALNTANLPAPDIADGGKHFGVITYTGNGTARSFTGLGFQPDFVWIKSRAGAVHGAANHGLFDAVRGTNKGLFSSSTATEGTFTHTLTSFDTDGFSLGTDADWGGTNQSSTTYVAWCWLAGNGTSSNTDGSITSTVSANPSAGFSIVTYSGTSTDNDTIGHGLGVAPAMVIVKNRTSAANGSAGSHWLTRHQAIGMTGSGNSCQLFLNLTNGLLNNDHGTLITSGNNLLQIKASGSAIPYFHVGESGQNYVAYCFAEVEGYSKFGSYTGNGSTDGPFVYCGFKPALIVTRRTDSGTDWKMCDNARGAYNQNNNHLAPNLSGSEQTDLGVDFLSNGFKLRNSGSSPNASGGDYIFMAWAENPFGGDGVSPATAR